MNGHKIQGTPIVVDFWRIRQCAQNNSVFFLSHAHSDHCQGLTSSWSEPIYTSELTAKIANHLFKVPRKLFKTLEIGCPHVIEQLNGGTFTVTLVDANHCPGSVMFIFEGQFGVIMYTGDFRFAPEMSQDSLLTSYCARIDKLYLDNTYCAPVFDFPLRETVTQDIMNLIVDHPEHEVIIGLWKLGKEDLLERIAQKLKKYIVVNPQKYSLLQILGCSDVFLTYKPDCEYIKAVPLFYITPKSVAQWNTHVKVLFIIPTALYIGQDVNPFSEFNNVFVMPYSDHSSYKELHCFVSMLKPKFIFPIVTGKNHNGHSINDMSCFSNNLTTSSPLSTPKLNFKATEESITSANSGSGKRNFSLTKRRRRAIRRPVKRNKPGVVYESCSSENESEQLQVSEKVEMRNREFSDFAEQLQYEVSVSVSRLRLRKTERTSSCGNGHDSSGNLVEVSPKSNGDESNESNTNGHSSSEARTPEVLTVINAIEEDELLSEVEVCENGDRLSPDIFRKGMLENVSTEDVHAVNLQAQSEDNLVENDIAGHTSFNNISHVNEQEIQSVGDGDALEIITSCSDIVSSSESIMESSEKKVNDGENVVFGDGLHIDWRKYQKRVEKLLEMLGPTEGP